MAEAVRARTAPEVALAHDLENAPPDSNQCGRPATPYPEERMAATIPGDDYGGDSQTRGEGTSSFAPSRTGP